MQMNIQSRLLPVARAKLEQYLGELEDEDLLNFVLEHVREQKGPDELVEGLEIVSGIRPVFLLLSLPFLHP